MGFGIDGAEYLFKNKEIFLYPISKVSQAFTDAKIPRTTQTIQKWELAMIIPETPFRYAEKRLYTKEWIRTLVKIAKKNRIRSRGSIKSFSLEAWEELGKMKEELLNGEEIIFIEKKR